jgi:hypothetical protein
MIWENTLPFYLKNLFGILNEFIKKFNAKSVAKDFSYNSEENDDFLSISQIKELIKNI